MNTHMWIVMGLAMVAAGGVVQVFIYPYLSGDIKAEKRQAALRSPDKRTPKIRLTPRAAENKS